MKPFTSGEDVKKCTSTMKLAKIVSPENQQFFKTANSFVNMVAEYRNDLAGNKQCQLKEKCNFVVVYSNATIASTDVKSNTQLAFFPEALIRNFNKWRSF
jgi:hypothetical protein